MTIGERIRAVRSEKGMTQCEVGKKSGIAEPTIRRYELGKLNPKQETLQKIADVLEVDVNWLRSGQTLEQRDQGMKDYVAQRFTEAELETRLRDSFSALSIKGKEKAVESVEIIAGNPTFQKSKDE